MNYSFEEIQSMLNCIVLSSGNSDQIQNVIYDTRKSSYASKSIFFAFKGAVNDGHEYIAEAYALGVRNFVVSKKINVEHLKDANVLKVNSSLLALQKIARFHRSKLNIPIIAITGSNGKTIVKEWLGKALSKKFKISKSPKSYNSQIGVALSLLQIKDKDQIAIIEAGISQKREMKFLEKMIRPNIGIFTNIGDAHASGFDSKDQKLTEKLSLFKHSELLIYNSDQQFTNNIVKKCYSGKLQDWSSSSESSISYRLNQLEDQTDIFIQYHDSNYKVNTEFKSKEFIENMMHVISCLLYFDFSEEDIQSVVSDFDQIQNRLELREGINGNLLINDSYSLDMASLQLALEFQDLHANGLEKILILSDFDHQVNKKDIYIELKNLIFEKNIKQTFIIGIANAHKRILIDPSVSFYNTVEEFTSSSPYLVLKDSCLLIKGARKFRLESIFHKLSKQVHQTILETNFSALDHNLNFYKKYLADQTKMMAVIKADSYGSGSEQIAHYLDQKKIDYLAVAIIDEAITIRLADCNLPIMVFNIDESQIELLWEHNLEPEVYSIHLLEKLINKANEREQELKIHIKLDTGMKRLGFEQDEINALLENLKNQKWLHVQSVFSHLAASESKVHDSFTLQQITLFKTLVSQIQESLNYPFLKHILNTGGIIRHSDHQMDMVRIGLGLYGVDETGLVSDNLLKVHSLKARVLQIKSLNKGETIGYSRAGIADQNKTIAIVSIGYADGLMRHSGNGNYSMKIQDFLCPTIGNICMDVCMLDITGIQDISVGDEVVVFDEDLQLESLAKVCHTISYEIISRIAPRVKRIYTYH